MPSSWSSKDERQYEHVKESEQKQGASTKRAKEIAARTVNKHRAEEGRASTGSRSGKAKSSSGGGSKAASSSSSGTTKKRSGSSGSSSGRTKRSAGGSGRDLEAQSVKELRSTASKLEIEGRSKMRKAELVAAIRKSRG